GIGKADYEPRATENIPDMIRYIEGLIEKGYAYATNTGVYFSVRKFTSYGKLSGQSIEQMETGVRKEADETKQDPLDFALWKASKEGEPFWESPWGKGRPGWHIECSVMSRKYLKTDTLDIHAGGRDLIFPHHENELAQAEALTGKQFAKYWIHHGLLTINGQKMSKSLGNFVTIKDFLAKYRHPEFLKLFFLSAHYSHPIDYNEEKIREAKEALERIVILLDKIGHKSAGTQEYRNADRKFGDIEKIKAKFIEAMDDDFNTPQALASLFELVTLTNKNMDNDDFIRGAKRILLELTGLLGLDVDDFIHKLRKPENVNIKPDALIGTIEQAALGSDIKFIIDDESIKNFIEKRKEAKKNRDFKEADKIRKELESEGIILEDNKDGTTSWRRKL
ncbi:MAG: cysteine--tRNA ligase, partial [Candidatus Omnitrophica bacterium]|nr:cysteine--tRNA ligase [Candidatus Omnitrophota bacterium]